MSDTVKTAGVQIYVPLSSAEKGALKDLKRRGRTIGVFVADAIREKLARERKAEEAEARR